MATTETTILQDVLTRLKTAKQASSWPDHPVAQAGLVANSAGFLLNASVQWKYNRGEELPDQQEQKARMRTEAINTAMNAIRFLENL